MGLDLPDWIEGVLRVAELEYCGLHAVEIEGLGIASMRVHGVLTLPLVQRLAERLGHLYVSGPLAGADVGLARDATGFNLSLGSSRHALSELFVSSGPWENGDFFLTDTEGDVRLAETEAIRIEAPPSAVLAFNDEERFLVASRDRERLVATVNAWLGGFSPDLARLDAAGCDLGWRCLAWSDELISPAAEEPGIEEPAAPAKGSSEGWGDGRAGQDSARSP